MAADSLGKASKAATLVYDKASQVPTKEKAGSTFSKVYGDLREALQNSEPVAQDLLTLQKWNTHTDSPKRTRNKPDATATAHSTCASQAAGWPLHVQDRTTPNGESLQKTLDDANTSTEVLLETTKLLKAPIGPGKTQNPWEHHPRW